MKKMTITTGAIILKDKKILLARRADHDVTLPGHWGCAGGRQDPGEELTDTVRREVKEEIGLDFSPTEEFGTYEMDYEGILLIQHVFLGNFSGELDLDPDEASECRWFTYDEAKDLNFSFSYKKVLDDLHKKDMI
jgi:mutator protein MutT